MQLARSSGPPPIHAPRLTRRKKVLFSLVVLLLGLGGVEVAVRIRFGNPHLERLPLSLVRAHRTRGWEMVPNTDHYTYEHLVSVNRLGLRGPDLPEKAPDELRILVVGDSFVAGVSGNTMLPADVLFATRVPEILGRPGYQAACYGWGPRQFRRAVAELAPRLRPSWVVIATYLENDLGDVWVFDGWQASPFETYAEFRDAQDIHVAPLDATFRVGAGERIMIEISRKFDLNDLQSRLAGYGLAARRVFTDDRDWFALVLLQRTADHA